jgi:hypothetical protein
MSHQSAMIKQKCIGNQGKSGCDAKRGHFNSGSFNLIEAQSYMVTLGASETVGKEGK